MDALARQWPAADPRGGAFSPQGGVIKAMAGALGIACPLLLSQVLCLTVCTLYGADSADKPAVAPDSGKSAASTSAPWSFSIPEPFLNNFIEQHQLLLIFLGYVPIDLTVTSGPALALSTLVPISSDMLFLCNCCCKFQIRGATYRLISKYFIIYDWIEHSWTALVF